MKIRSLRMTSDLSVYAAMIAAEPTTVSAVNRILHVLQVKGEAMAGMIEGNENSGEALLAIAQKQGFNLARAEVLNLSLTEFGMMPHCNFRSFTVIPGAASVQQPVLLPAGADSTPGAMNRVESRK